MAATVGWGDYYGPMLYDWGYSSYYNPYYNPATIVVEQPLVYDYSQPLSAAAARALAGRSPTRPRPRSIRPERPSRPGTMPPHWT